MSRTLTQPSGTVMWSGTMKFDEEGTPGARTPPHPVVPSSHVKALAPSAGERTAAVDGRATGDSPRDGDPAVSATGEGLGVDVHAASVTTTSAMSAANGFRDDMGFHPSVWWAGPLRRACASRRGLSVGGRWAGSVAAGAGGVSLRGRSPGS